MRRTFPNASVISVTTTRETGTSRDAATLSRKASVSAGVHSAAVYDVLKTRV